MVENGGFVVPRPPEGDLSRHPKVIHAAQSMADSLKTKKYRRADVAQIWRDLWAMSEDGIIDKCITLRSIRLALRFRKDTTLYPLIGNLLYQSNSPDVQPLCNRSATTMQPLCNRSATGEDTNSDPTFSPLANFPPSPYTPAPTHTHTPTHAPAHTRVLIPSPTSTSILEKVLEKNILGRKEGCGGERNLTNSCNNPEFPEGSETSPVIGSEDTEVSPIQVAETSPASPHSGNDNYVGGGNEVSGIGVETEGLTDTGVAAILPEEPKKPRKRRARTKASSEGLEAGFEDWWAEYPPARRVNKPKCLKKWIDGKLCERKDQIKQDTIAKRTTDPQWLNGFIVLTTTYLNQLRYDQEITQLTLKQKAFQKIEQQTNPNANLSLMKRSWQWLQDVPDRYSEVPGFILQELTRLGLWTPPPTKATKARITDGTEDVQITTVNGKKYAWAGGIGVLVEDQEQNGEQNGQSIPKTP